MSTNTPEPTPQTDEQPFTDKNWIESARLFITGGVILFAIVVIMQPGDSANEVESNTNYWQIWGTRGDFTAGLVGTLFGIAGFIYVFLSFKKQRESNDMQAAQFEHEKVDVRFFNLINLHRANISELVFKFQQYSTVVTDNIPYVEKYENEVVHRQVFQAIKNQFFDLYDETDFIFNNAIETDIYEEEYLEIVKANATFIERGTNRLLLARIDILYLCVFFGVGNNGSASILSLTVEKYKKDFIGNLLSFIRMKPKVESKLFEHWWRLKTAENSFQIFNAIHNKRVDSSYESEYLKLFYFKYKSKLYPFNPFYAGGYEKYYGGHQFRLGHYFRHIFQTVEFIHTQENLKEKAKYDYIKHLRGQFSTDEQIIFFLNSISQLGRRWELENKKDGSSVVVKDHLITHYQLIKNIPANDLKGAITLSEFYPNVDYEGFLVA